ncbi:MAG TPA: hypothetical protein VKR24_08330 [Candidatus Limnocylindrales bacterium]|nr:hypothetical protein [Candidatus Limnocylindrales bacterium]
MAIRRPALWPVALAGFLARGGVVLFVVPVVFLPSLVGLATFIDPASITPTGPTAGLVIRIAVAAVVVVAALLAGTLAAGAAEIDLIRAGSSADIARPGELRRVGLIRLIGLIPVAIALALGIERLGEIVYQELTLPTDLVTPIVIRVASRAPDVVAAIIVAWLFGETWAGLATRLAVIRGASLVAALAGGLVLIVRRAPAVVALLASSSLVALLVLGVAISLVGGSWDLVQQVLLGGAGIGTVAGMAGSVLLFASAWLVALVAAGILATWRGLAWTLVVGEDHRGSGGMPVERATL